MNRPRVVSTVEARMGSTRLPGKTLLPILGKPTLEILLERLRRARSIDEIVVATTVLPEDRAIEDLCRNLGVTCFRGSPEDVLKRVSQAAEKARADIVVEITGDCPLTCPEVVDEAVELFLEGGMDYLSNLKEQTYPQAVDVRVFRAMDLKEVDERLAGTDRDVREHVYLYFEEHPERYRIHVMKAPPEYHRPQWRLDLDYPEDLRLLTKIFGDLYPRNPGFTLKDLVSYLDSHPELRTINADMLRKPLRTSSCP